MNKFSFPLTFSSIQWAPGAAFWGVAVMAVNDGTGEKVSKFACHVAVQQKPEMLAG